MSSQPTIKVQPLRPSKPSKFSRPTRHFRPSFENPANPIDEGFLRPFIASCVGQLDDVTNERILMLRSLIPVVTDCLVSVARSFKSSKQQQQEANAMNIKLAQALFRKNPNYVPQSIMQQTITKLINEEIVALRVRKKEEIYKKHSPVIYELFHNYDHDGDSYISLSEIKNLLHDVGGILGFDVLQAHDLIEMLDFHNTGHVDFSDFEMGMNRLFKEDQIKSALDLIEKEGNNPHDVHLRLMSHRDEFLLEHAERTLYKMLKKRNFDLRSVFNDLDRNQDDSISVKELSNALRELSNELENHGKHNDKDCGDKECSKKDSRSNYSKSNTFSGETVALLLNKERLDEDGDHCVDYLEFKKFSHNLMKYHGVEIARRASFQATSTARLKLWDSACRSIHRTNFLYESLEKTFINIKKKSEVIDPLEKTLDSVMKNSLSAREALDATCKSLKDVKLIIANGFQDTTYRSLLELSIKCSDACQNAKIHVGDYAQSVLVALQLHEELVEENYLVNDHFTRFSILKGRCKELENRWNNRKSKQHAYTNEYTEHTMVSLNNIFEICLDLRRHLSLHLTTKIDLDNMKNFTTNIDKFEKKLILAESEIEDAETLEKAHIAFDAAMRSASLEAMGRSLVAAVCRSAAPRKIFIALFLQTSNTEATCIACGQQGIKSIFNIDEERNTGADGGSTIKGADIGNEKVTNNNDFDNDTFHQQVSVGTVSRSGDDFGFDSLRLGAVHKTSTCKNRQSFMQPLISEDHCSNISHTKSTHPFAYLYIEKGEKEKDPLSPRLIRFIKTLSILSADRMSKIEQIDRLLRIGNAASTMLSNVASASTFIGLRIGQSGIRFLSGTNKFKKMVDNVSFIKAKDARTLMAASESNKEARSARCKGPCLAWRCGQVISNISVIVGVADMSTDEYHTEVFKAAQKAAMKICSFESNDKKPLYHMGDEVEKVFLEARMLEVVGGGGGIDM